MTVALVVVWGCSIHRILRLWLPRLFCFLRFSHRTSGGTISTVFVVGRPGVMIAGRRQREQPQALTAEKKKNIH